MQEFFMSTSGVFVWIIIGIVAYSKLKS